MAIVKQSLRFLLFIPLIFASVNRANAQSVIPAKDGLNTSVNQVGNQYNITGGTQAGANLFQSLQKLGLNANEIANFVSNPSIQNILTRVTGGQASLINGLIQVTGGNSNLYILNPAGIIFGATASLNVPASFSATTATAIQVGNGWFGINSSISDVLNLTGSITGYAFTPINSTALSTGQAGAIVNQGNLSVSNGNSVTLVGGIVVNTGTISAPEGNITIAATPDNKFVEISNDNNVLSLDLPIADQKTIGNATLLSGANLPSLLTGKTVGTSSVSGTLDVSGNNGGNVRVLGTNVSLASANINASGVNGGGTVLIGGDLHGAGLTPTAQTTTVDANSTISADALTNGNGGKVIVWSDNTTTFDGNISARGGSLSGNGGFTEVSGKLNLAYNGLVDLRALNGTTGNLILDPATFTIASSGGDITPATVISQWNAANTIYSATSSLTVTDPIAGNSYNTLTLDAPTINLNAGITNFGSVSGALSGTANNTTVNVGPNGLIQNGVDVAASGANVNLSATTYTQSSTVNKSLTLNGLTASSTIVNPSPGALTFYITGGSTVNINNLTVANGYGSPTGGIQIDLGSTLNLNNCSFFNNASSLTIGGAIYNSGIITIVNSTFSNNSAGTGSGGAIYNAGTATIVNSTFTNNSVTGGGSGGAIFNAGTATIANSTFSNNSAFGIPGNGGSSGSGGAIDNQGALTIYNSTFSNNSATGGTGVNGGIGGAIYNAGTATIVNSTFFNNSVTSEGGAIYDQGLGITISNSLLTGDSASVVGSEEVYSFGNLNFIGANIVGTNGANGISGSFFGFTPITPTGAANTIINTTLANNGGPTQTLTLAPGSIAIDASSNAGSAVPTTTDQRGYLAFSIRDIGAFEFDGILPAPTPTTPTPTTPTPTPITSVPIPPNFPTTLPPGSQTVLPTTPPSTPNPQHQKAEQDINKGNLADAIVNLESSYISELEDYTGIALELTGTSKEIIENIQKELSRTSKITGSPTALVYPVILDNRLETLVVFPSGKILQKTVADSPRDVLLREIADFREALLDPSSNDYLAEAQRLNTWLIEPIEKSLQAENIGTLVFILDGALRAIPPAALYDGKKFLVEKYAIASVPSMRLAKLEERDRKNSQVLAMGLTKSVQGFSALPSVSTEVGNIVGSNNNPALLNGNSFINESFTVKNMQAQRQKLKYGIIHLATHAQFLSEKADGAFIQFFDDRLTIKQIPQLSLDKPQVEMLTLSACQTAVGNNLGIAGLAVTSGVRSVLASLWKVSDTGTVPLMLSFYSRFADAPSKAIALQKAQIAVLEGKVKIENDKIIGIPGLPAIPLPSNSSINIKHPYFWSSFVLVGSWL